jgi:hypothetical protein
MIWIILAILFVVVLFLLKNDLIFKNDGKEMQTQEGLVYGTETLEDLINKDIDNDGVLDWEESLLGTDPNRKDTDDNGIPDNIEIARLKAEQGLTLENEQTEGEEELTQTDRFSRELFSTISTLSQNGPIDQATADELGSTLAEQIKNPPVQKVFLTSDLKIIKDSSTQAIKTYDAALISIYAKHPTGRTVIDVLQDFVIDEENVNVTALEDLDPIITQINGIMDEMLKMNVPQSLSVLHLDVINGLERLVENIANIKLFEIDVVVSLGAISQYETNTDLLEQAVKKLTTAIQTTVN